MDCSLPGSSVHRIFQARVLEWLPFSSPEFPWLKPIPCMCFILIHNLSYRWFLPLFSFHSTSHSGKLGTIQIEIQGILTQAFLFNSPRDWGAQAPDSTCTRGQAAFCAPGPCIGLARSVEWLSRGHRWRRAYLVWHALALVCEFLLCWQKCRHSAGMSRCWWCCSTSKARLLWALKSRKRL